MIPREFRRVEQRPENVFDDRISAIVRMITQPFQKVLSFLGRGRPRQAHEVRSFQSLFVGRT